MHLVTVLHVLIALAILLTIHFALTTRFRPNLMVALVLIEMGIFVFLGTVYYHDIYQDDRGIGRLALPIIIIGYACLVLIVKIIRKRRLSSKTGHNNF